jgi:hypothetical protein
MSISLRRAAGRIPRGFLGMLALVAVFESYIARNDLKFSRIEAQDWKTCARVASGELPPGGVFFFGDSQIKFGVSPLLLESKLGQPSHCLAIQGGQAPSSYFMLRRALKAGVAPAAIVVDFEPHLNYDGIKHNKRMWPELVDLGESLELAWHAGDADAFSSMALGMALPSYRERSEIRENIQAALRGETYFMSAWIDMASRNMGMNRGAVALTKNPANPPIDTSKWGNPTPKPWAPDPVNKVYARKFLQLAADNKIPVYCLIMPVAPALLEKYEKNGLEREYTAWLKKLQQGYANLFVLDWRHSNYRDPSFSDGLHLNVEGALAITSALGDYLQHSFRGEGIDVRWVQMPSFRQDDVAIAVEDSNRSDSFMRSTATRRR